MGEYVNFISGISEDMLPLGEIGGILDNTPNILNTLNSYEKTKTIFDKSEASYRMIDSGGFQMFLINEENLKIIDPAMRTMIIMNPALPITMKRKFNLTAEHVALAVELLAPDIVVCPDLPTPKPNDPDQKRYLYLNSIGYNIYSAFQMSIILKEKGSSAKLLVPIQAYDLAELQLYLNHLKYLHFDGLSFPCRLMTLERMAAFFVKAYIEGVKIIHVLGTGRFSYIAFIAYFARNLFDFTSIDSTNLQKFSQVNSYLMPWSLTPLSLRMDSTDDLRKPITCTCPWCRYYSSFSAIQNLPTWEKRSFVVNHNHSVTEKLMADAYEHATTARALYDFLREKTNRHDDCREVYRVLSLVEAARAHLGNESIMQAFYRKLGF
jgi:queuine/archaeosine tRNA-ribosyltransferase